MACLPKTVSTVTAVNELYPADCRGAIPHLGDTATLFLQKTSFFGAQLGVGGQGQLHDKTGATTGPVFAMNAAAVALGGGGTKRGQQRDIDKAKDLLAEFKARKKAMASKAGNKHKG